MRRKISKRIKKNATRLGATIVKERWVKRPELKRKEWGYSVIANYNGWSITSLGKDELDAYRGLLDTITDDEICNNRVECCRNTVLLGMKEYTKKQDCYTIYTQCYNDL